MKTRVILSLLFLLSFGSVRAADLFIEAESFSNKGGWKVDQQFMDLMGSPYLLAHGMGVPVDDASTEVTFPEKGEYYVYVLSLIHIFKYPRLTYTNTTNTYTGSDYWLFNGAYFRVKNITLGYSLPQKLMDKCLSLIHISYRKYRNHHHPFGPSRYGRRCRDHQYRNKETRPAWF